jgi:hypothetical protein
MVPTEHRPCNKIGNDHLFHRIIPVLNLPVVFTLKLLPLKSIVFIFNLNWYKENEYNWPTIKVHLLYPQQTPLHLFGEILFNRKSYLSDFLQFFPNNDGYLQNNSKKLLL